MVGRRSWKPHWGRFETARYLVEQGVDIKARDGNNMQAVDLAANTIRNEQERANRSGGSHLEPARAEERRRRLKTLFKRRTPAQTQSGGKALSRGAFFNQRSDGTLEIYRLHTLLESPSEGKTFATLDRGPNYPYVNAMSGYSHHGWPNVLDNKVWTAKAQELREHLGLSWHKGMASHVEPRCSLILCTDIPCSRCSKTKQPSGNLRVSCLLIHCNPSSRSANSTSA